jgi:ketosteroid isomerase-like protein
MMKTLLVWCASCLLATSLAHAQQPAADREADHEALRGLMKKVVKSLNDQDMNALASCFTKDFSLISIDQTLITNQAALVAYYDAMFRSDKFPLKSMVANPKADALTQFLDAEKGVCHGTSSDTYLFKNGRKVVMDSRWTAVVVKEGGEWKIASAHAGVNFLDNPLRPRGFWQKFKLLFKRT